MSLLVPVEALPLVLHALDDEALGEAHAVADLAAVGAAEVVVAAEGADPVARAHVLLRAFGAPPAAPARGLLFRPHRAVRVQHALLHFAVARHHRLEVAGEQGEQLARIVAAAAVLVLARARVGLAEQAEQLGVLPLALRHLSAGCVSLLHASHASHVVAQRRAEQQRVPRLVEVVAAIVARAAGVRLRRRGARAAAVLLHLLGAVGLRIPPPALKCVCVILILFQIVIQIEIVILRGSLVRGLLVVCHVSSILIRFV